MEGEGMAALPQDVTYDGVDVEFLRRKYTEERAKRLNPKGNSQYVEVTGDFSRYIDDPYVDGPLVRDAVDETVEAFVIGGGFGGLLAAAELHKIGEIGRAHVCTPVTNAHLVCRLLLEKKN